VAELGEAVFMDCKSLETAIFKMDRPRLCDSYAGVRPQLDRYNIGGLFQRCSSLTSFTSLGHLNSIPSSCFEDCIKLEEFNYPEDDYVGNIRMYAFKNCASLKYFPYLKETIIYRDKRNQYWDGSKWVTEDLEGSYAFQNCTSLLQLSLPEIGIDKAGHASYLLQGASDLQSLIFPYKDNKFNLQAEDIDDAPLEGISYSYVDNINPIPTLTNAQAASITKYAGNNARTAASPTKSNLYVVRGQKWKYIEAGYGELFNIMEMKDPRIDIKGDIFSTYDAEKNVNHYKTALRWQFYLSDLNENGQTKVHLYRDNVKVADIVFEKPVEQESISGYTKPVIAVDYTVDGEANGFVGDFDYPETDADGNVTYVEHYAYNAPIIYFDAETSKRVGSFDDTTSWFTFVDEFDSPVLSEPNVPTEYHYYAVMEGYDYSKLVNNEDFVEADGLRYHAENAKFEDMTSEVHPIEVPMAIPTIAFEGIYTSDQIAEDSDHALEVTPTNASCKRQYLFNYTLDADLVAQKGRKYSETTTNYIITDVTLDEWDVENKLQSTLGTKTLGDENRQNVGNFSVDNSTVAVGNKYQTVTKTTFRGTFGSPVITVPDVPTFKAEVTSLTLNDNETNYVNDFAFNSEVTISPVMLTSMGYDSNNLPADRTAYRLGLWRTVPETETTTAALGEPIYFETGASSATDEDETSNLAIDENNLSMTYSDAFHYTQLNQFVYGYDGRIYVKVPEGMLRNDDAWMIADVKATKESTLTSGVEGVMLDGDGATDKDALWYDLQGRRVTTPVSGNPYIRVTSQGATKIIYR
jgi:hypothetical protein